jgi:hypothetical protein
MLATLLFATAAFVMTPDPLKIEVGQTVIVTVDAPGALWYGGYFGPQHNRIADIAGHFPPKAIRGRARVIGLKPGTTKLTVTYVSGMSVYTTVVGTIVVVEKRCTDPAVTLPETRLRVSEGQPVTLGALTSGTEPVTIEWLEGDTILGTANPLTITLPPGIHRITARVTNDCGTASAEAEVEVTPARRRSVRH